MKKVILIQKPNSLSKISSLHFKGVEVKHLISSDIIVNINDQAEDAHHASNK